MFCTNCRNEIDDKAIVGPKCEVPIEGKNNGVIKSSNVLIGAALSLFCCWPLGSPAIVFACRANSKLKAGDIQGAQKMAKTAKTLTIVGIILGLIYIFIHIIQAVTSEL